MIGWTPCADYKLATYEQIATYLRALEQATSTAPIAPEAVTMVAEYPSNDLLMSGWLLGERALTNRAAVVHARVGRGQLVLLGFRTQHRGQPHGTFKLLFNSLYLGGMRRVAVR